MGEDYCAFAEELAAAAGRVALEYFRRPLKVDDKAAGVPGKEFDPVTEADRAAERLMREMIAARYPDHGIAGEEFADTKVLHLPMQSIVRIEEVATRGVAVIRDGVSGDKIVTLPLPPSRLG